ncbi:MAG: hypothetical protein ACW976_01325 [Candidatus Ranarchaeia archaeon]|jgi:protein-S-isoprenylcysteine O-methyltransferase Ste14
MKLDLRLLYTLAVLVHGLGHAIGIFFLGLFPAQGFTTTSWILTDMLALPDVMVMGLASLWLVAMVGFLVVVWGFWTNKTWWKSATGLMVVFSILLFILWWFSFPANVPLQAQIGNAIAILGIFYFKSKKP